MPERILAVIMQLIGVMSFSFAAGVLISLISQIDQTMASNQKHIDVLNKIYIDQGLIPTDLYNDLYNQITTIDDKKDLNEKLTFLEDLPYRLKITTVMCIYQRVYTKVDYLNVQSENFLGWVCPLLKQEIIPVESYVYYETDIVNDIYFITKGSVGFVLPFKKNVVYIEINNGDLFGEIDINVAIDDNMPLEKMVGMLNTRNFNLSRQFTAVALENSTVLSMSL